MRKIRVMFAALAAMLVSFVAQATIVVTATNCGSAPPDYDLLTFGPPLPLGSSDTFLPNGFRVTTSGDAAIVQGSTVTYAAPYECNGSGAAFGQPEGVLAIPYATSGVDQWLRVTFPRMVQHAWFQVGSGDWYNFFSTATWDLINDQIPLASVVHPPIGMANGNQGPGGTFGIQVDTTYGFNQFYFGSRQFNMEIPVVGVPHDEHHRVPLPSTLALIALAAALLVIVQHRPQRA